MASRLKPKHIIAIIGALAAIITAIATLLGVILPYQKDREIKLTPQPTGTSIEGLIEFSVLILLDGNGTPASNTRVTIYASELSPVFKYTGNDGYAEFTFGREHLGKTVEITIEKEGYPVKTISHDLGESSPPITIQLQQ